MVSGQPRLRGASCHVARSVLRRTEPAAYQEVKNRVPAESATAVICTGRAGWVSIEHDAPFVEGLVAVLGEVGAADIVRRSVMRYVKTPILESLVRGTTRIFGMGPGSIVKILPRAWPMVYRDFLELALEHSGDGVAVLRMSNIHERVFDYPGYFASWHGIYDAVFQISDTAGSYRATIDEATRSGRIEFEW